MERIFNAIELLQAVPAGLTMTELGSRLDLPASSTHDLLAGLVAERAVIQRSDRRYTLGPRIVGLALSIVESFDLVAIAQQYAAELSEHTSEDVLIAVRAGDTVMYASRHEGSAPLKANIRLGQPRPLHGSSAGKLFTAYHDDLRAVCLSPDGVLHAHTAATITSRERLNRHFDVIRRLGLSISNEESLLGVVGFAAPIFDAQGAVTLAVHISLPVQRATVAHLEEVVPQLILTATSISTRVGGSYLPQEPELMSSVYNYLGL